MSYLNKKRYFLGLDGELLVENIKVFEQGSLSLSKIKNSSGSGEGNKTSTSSTTASKTTTPGNWIEDPKEADLQKDRKKLVSLIGDAGVAAHDIMINSFKTAHTWFDYYDKEKTGEYTSRWANYQGSLVTLGDFNQQAADEVLGTGSGFNPNSDTEWTNEITRPLIDLQARLKKLLPFYDNVLGKIAEVGVHIDHEARASSDAILKNYIPSSNIAEKRKALAEKTGIQTSNYQDEYCNLLRGCYDSTVKFWVDLRSTLRGIIIKGGGLYTSNAKVTMFPITKYLTDTTLKDDAFKGGGFASKGSMFYTFWAPL